MKTSFNNYEPSFGMALHIPNKKQVEKKLGGYLAEQLEIATPALERLAKDVDIFVKQVNDNNIDFRGFNIKVKKIEENPLKNLFGNFSYMSTNVSLYEEKRYLKSISEMLVGRTKSTVEDFKKYSK